jgi:hypothetical protein
MKKLLLVLIILFLLILSNQTTKEDTNDWDHMGTSFAVQTLVYGISSKFLGIGTHQKCEYSQYYNTCFYTGYGKVFNRTEAVIFSSLITFLGTTTYSYLKAQQSHTNVSGREILMNGIGQAAAIGTIYTFKF